MLDNEILKTEVTLNSHGEQQQKRTADPRIVKTDRKVLASNEKHNKRSRSFKKRGNKDSKSPPKTTTNRRYHNHTVMNSHTVRLNKMRH